MRFTEIDAITLEQRINEVLILIFGEEKTFSFNQISDDEFLSDDENYYNKLNIEGVEEKPPYQDFINALDSIKKRLKQERSNDLYDSVNIEQLAFLFYEQRVALSDRSSFIKNKADQDDQDFFDQCYLKMQEYVVIKRDNEAIAFGAKVNDICERAIKLITGMNAYEKSLTTVQIAQMKLHFKEVHDLLKDGEPRGAYLLLQAMQPLDDANAPDGETVTIVSQDDIDRFNNFLLREIEVLSGS